METVAEILDNWRRTDGNNLIITSFISRVHRRSDVTHNLAHFDTIPNCRHFTNSLCNYTVLFQCKQTLLRLYYMDHKDLKYYTRIKNSTSPNETALMGQGLHCLPLLHSVNNVLLHMDSKIKLNGFIFKGNNYQTHYYFLPKWKSSPQQKR